MANDFTQLLNDVDAGREEARVELLDAAYAELRRIAAGAMDDERQDHTLTATALVNELSIKLMGDVKLPTDGRRPFFAYAAKAMRNLLVDHARKRSAQKRGGGRQALSLDEAVVACRTQSEGFLALNESLQRLEAFDAQKAAVVEMRYFGGLAVTEVAEALEISPATVKRQWSRARAWLLHDLQQGDTAVDASGGETL